MKQTSNVKMYVLLHALMFLFSLSPVCSKLAGRQPFLSVPFFVFYGLVIVILGVYALAWQQVIKRMPLTTAYANKAVTVVWGMVWGMLLFGESITPQKVLGAAVIVAGVVLYAFAEPEQKEESAHE